MKVAQPLSSSGNSEQSARRGRRVGGHLTLARGVLGAQPAPFPEQPPEQPLRVSAPAHKLTQGRVAITQVTKALVAAGHDIPDTQEAHLQFLEHGDDARIRASILALSVILDGEPPKRRPVLEQRLARIEEFADDVATRDAAAALRRKL